MDGLNLLYARSREFYEGLTPRRRQALLAMVGVSVALVVGLSIWAGRPQWTPVIAGLEPAQAQTLVQTLFERKGAQAVDRGQGPEVQNDSGQTHFCELAEALSKLPSVTAAQLAGGVQEDCVLGHGRDRNHHGKR